MAKTLTSAAALLGRKGGEVRGASKRRDIDYAALGRKGAEAKRKKRENEKRGQ